MLRRWNRVASCALSFVLCSASIPASAVAEAVAEKEPTKILYALSRVGDEEVEPAWSSYVAPQDGTSIQAESQPQAPTELQPQVESQPQSVVGSEPQGLADSQGVEELPGAVKSLSLAFSDDTRGLQMRASDELGTWDESWAAENEQGVVTVTHEAVTDVEVRLVGEAGERIDVWYRKRANDGTWLAGQKAEEYKTEKDAAEAKVAEESATAQKADGASADPLATTESVVEGNEAEGQEPAPLCDFEAVVVEEGAEAPEGFAPPVEEEGNKGQDGALKEGAQSAESGANNVAAQVEVQGAPGNDVVNEGDVPDVPTVVEEVEVPEDEGQGVEPAPMASLLSTSARTLSKGATTSTPKPDESPVLQAAAEVPAVITWKRLAGASRYSTMSAIVSEGFGDSDWAIVASGSNFPDALVASALAGAYDCPIIITDPNELSTEAANQLLRMDVDYVFIMGGTSAVSEDVELGIEELGIMTYRVSGSSRLETSVRALGEVRDAGSTSNTIIVASGTKYADALSIGPWAYLKKAPIILAGSNGLLTDEEVEAIQSDEYVTQILIVGGPSAVSRSIRDQLGDQFGYKRLEGEDRFETNREVMAWTADNGLSWTQPAVASGANYPDALVGAAFSGSKGSVLALNHSSTIGMITAHKSSVMRGYILGGKSAVASVNGVTSTDTLDGVDISGWDAGVDAGSLYADFAIIKSTEGLQGTIYNPEYKKMADAALKSGKLIGFYHYANGEDPVKEADSFYESIKAYKGRAIVCLDWEGDGNKLFDSGLDVGWCKKFLDRLQSRFGGTPLIYTSKNWTNKYDWSQVAAKYPLWGAEYAYASKPYYDYEEDPWQSDAKWGAWGYLPTIFQYASTGVLENNAGIEYFDINKFYGTRTTWQNLQG